MSTGANDGISIRCPECNRRLKVPPKLAGKRVPCPACKGLINLPSLEEQPSKKPAIDLDHDLDDIGFKLADEVPKAKGRSSLAADFLHGGETELAEKEFSFPCKVCGTRMYAKPSDIGSMTRCPDCYAEYSVPSPPPPKAKPTSPNLETIPEVALQPVEGKKVQGREFGRNSAQEYLAKAAEEVEKDDLDHREQVYDFDTSGWFKRTFSFLGDPSLLVIALTTGLLMGGTLIASETAGKMLPQAPLFAIILILILFGGPLLILTLANGVAVLEASANRLRRISQWPIFHPTDALGEIAVVVAAFLISVLPGGLIGWLASGFGLTLDLRMGLVFLSGYLLFPILLLSMLDNQSVAEPYSSDVLASIRSKADAWGAVYLMTGMAMGLIFLLYLVAATGSGGRKFLFGMLLPVLIFFIFHQIGVLGSRIADVTSLAFEGEESDEEPPAPDAPA